MPDQRRMQIAIEGAGGLMSINEAVAKGFSKLRLDKWANPDDYMQFDIINGRPGPWVRLWSPVNEIMEQENPQKLIIIELGDLDDPCWRPLPKSLGRV